MLLLVSITDKLQIVTASAGTIDVHASWMDNFAGSVIPGRTNTNITTAATVDIVASPPASTQRNVKTLHIRNRGATGNTITVQHTDGTTVSQLYKITLAPNQTQQYIDEIGFIVPSSIPSSIAFSASGGSGRLEYVSGTALSFKPVNGNLIKINTGLYVIPNTGIVGLSNTGIFLNGVAGQNLAASTMYYVYAFNNAGVITADFSAVGHATSVTAGNEGVEIKTGDDTRTLIGMIRTLGTSFVQDGAQNWVSSWFNRRNRLSAVAHGGTVGPTMAEVASPVRAGWLQWAGEAVTLTAVGRGSSTGTEHIGYLISLNTVSQVGIPAIGTTPVPSGYVPIAMAFAVTPAEGLQQMGFQANCTGSGDVACTVFALWRG